MFVSDIRTGTIYYWVGPNAILPVRTDGSDNFRQLCAYIYQQIQYSRACGSYYDFLDRGWLLTRKLLNEGFLEVKLKSSLRKLYGHHHDLFNNPYGITVSEMATRFATRVTCQVPHLVNGVAYPFRGALKFTSGYQWDLCCSIFSFLSSVLQTIVCPFVLFPLVIVLSVLLQFTASDYPLVSSNFS